MNKQEEYKSEKIKQLYTNAKIKFEEICSERDEKNQFENEYELVDKDKTYFGPEAKITMRKFRVNKISENCFLLTDTEDSNNVKVVSNIEFKGNKITGYDGISITKDTKTSTYNYKYFPKNNAIGKTLANISEGEFNYLEDAEFFYKNPNNLEFIETQANLPSEFLNELTQKAGVKIEGLDTQIQSISGASSNKNIQQPTAQLYNLKGQAALEMFKESEKTNTEQNKTIDGLNGKLAKSMEAYKKLKDEYLGIYQENVNMRAQNSKMEEAINESTKDLKIAQQENDDIISDFQLANEKLKNKEDQLAEYEDLIEQVSDVVGGHGFFKGSRIIKIMGEFYKNQKKDKPALPPASDQRRIREEYLADGNIVNTKLIEEYLKNPNTKTQEENERN